MRIRGSFISTRHDQYPAYRGKDPGFSRFAEYGRTIQNHLLPTPDKKAYVFVRSSPNPMKGMKPHESALSETIAQLLIAFLVILVALLIIGALTGVLPRMLQKSAFITVTASSYDTSPTTHVILLYHKQGDLVNLNGTSQAAGVSEIAITLTPPSGSPVLVRNATPLSTTAWGPGQYLVIYETTPGTYGYSDQPPAGADLSDDGEYSVQIIDTKVNVLLHTLPVTIG